MHTKMDQFELLDPIALSHVAGGSDESKYCSQPGKLAFSRAWPLYHSPSEITLAYMPVVEISTCLTQSSVASSR
ncbi:MAG: hypothetical protein DI617_05790 [Streptococcus pyogenes]|nr:MAG: hypothetical protein DI617_05790 [Streptococcus pyogenes]